MTFYEFIKDIDNQIKNGGDLNYSFFDILCSMPIHFNPSIVLGRQWIYFAPDIIHTPYDENGQIDKTRMLQSSIDIYQNIIDDLTLKQADEKMLNYYKSRLGAIIEYKMLHEICDALVEADKENRYIENYYRFAKDIYYDATKSPITKKTADRMEKELKHRLKFGYKDKFVDEKYMPSVEVKFYSEESASRIEFLINGQLVFTVGENGI